MPSPRPRFSPLLRRLPSAKALALLLLGALLASCSSTKKVNTNIRLAPAPYYDSLTGIYFPGAIESLYRLPIAHLEDKTPGLGVAISYRDQRTKIDIFVYDLRASVIPTGIDAPVIAESFQSAIDDIARAAERGIYSNYQLLERDVAQLGQQRFLHARATYGENLLLRDAHLLVAGINGQIVKIRASMTQPSDFDVWRAFGHLANNIAQSRRNGYGGLSAAALAEIETALAAIDLDDGLQAPEAVAIAQMDLVTRKLHTRYDAETGRVVDQSDSRGRVAVEFDAFPTEPPRLAPKRVVFAIESDGESDLIDQSE